MKFLCEKCGRRLVTKEHPADVFEFAGFPIKAQDELCIQVADYEPRSFRWFRRNTAHVTIEGMEAA